MQAARKTTAHEVAHFIYDAATDGSTRLRYFVGEDVGGFVQAECQKTDQDYMEFMQDRFLS